MNERIEHAPYELMAEYDSVVATERIIKIIDTNPVEFRALLQGELQAIIHDGIEVGLGLADHFPTTGAPDLFDAFVAGYEYGKTS